MKKRAIIICQAGHEVSNVLSLYDKIKEQYDRITIVSNRTSSYKTFFEYLGIDADFEVWTSSHFSASSPMSWPKLIKTYQKEVKNLNSDGADVYYTCICDLNLSIRFSFFPKSVRFFYRPGKELLLIDQEGLPAKYPHKLKAYIVRYISQCFCKNKLYFRNHGDSFTLAFNPKDCAHTELAPFTDEISVAQKYRYNPKVSGENLVIFFTEPYRNKFQTEENYYQINRLIVENLQKKGYKVLMKGHPRIGICDSIKGIVDEIIPEMVPSEFIDYGAFAFAIGFVSTSLCNSSNYLTTYSVLDMCDIIDQKMANDWHVYLDKNSQNKVKYLKSFVEI